MLLRKPLEIHSELAAGIAKGDKAAFREMLDRHKEEVHFLLARLAGERTANALFIDVFLQTATVLSHAAMSEEERANSMNLPLKIATSLCDLRLCGAKRAFKGHRPPPIANIPYKGEVLRKFISAELSNMKPIEREVLVLSGIRGLKREDISDICGLETDEVKAVISRARAKLSERLRAHLGRGTSYHCGDEGRCEVSRYCTEAEWMFDDFVDVELDWIEKLILLSHLKKCRRCRMVLSDLNDVAIALKQPETYSVPRRLVEKAVAAFSDAGDQVS